MQTRRLTLENTADFLEAGTIEHSHDYGHAVIHVGKDAAGTPFVLVNDCYGITTAIENI